MFSCSISIRERVRLVAGKVSTVIPVLVMSTLVAAQAPYLRTDTPIKDDQGRVQVIIDFVDDAHMRYPGTLPTMPTKENFESRKGSEFFHTEKALALVSDYERRFNFTRTGMTSWVGNSVTAFLSLDTINRLQDDPLVKQVSDNQYDQSSSVPPSEWSDTTLAGGELDSWGRKAVHGKISTSNTGRKIKTSI